MYSWHEQLAVDFSARVIQEMKAKNALTRPGLRFEVMDVTKMALESSSVDVVLDKGLLDAMAADGDESAMEGVDKLFSEVVRVLKPGGKYLIVSLAQRHIVEKLLAVFDEAATGCTLEAGVLTAAAATSKLPPFLFTITKQPSSDEERISFRHRATATAEASAISCDADALLKLVQDSQWAHQSQQRLREINPGNYFSFQLWGEPGSESGAVNSARFNVTVVDSSSTPRVAVLIVPQGRETEFLFGQREGQEQVRGFCFRKRRRPRVAVGAWRDRNRVVTWLCLWHFDSWRGSKSLAVLCSCR